MQVEIQQKDELLVAELTGEWELDRPTPRFARLLDDAAPGQTVRAIGFDTTELGEWDSSLLAFLLQGRGYCETHDLEFREEGLPESIIRLLELAWPVLEADVEQVEDAAPFLAMLGSKGLASFDAFLASVSFTGEVALSVVRFLGLKVRLRWRDFWVVVQSNSSGALPIVTLISFLVGLIIAFLGAVVLRRFGAGYYVSYLVGFGMMREMGALMTGIIMAGRTGAASCTHSRLSSTCSTTNWCCETKTSSGACSRTSLFWTKPNVSKIGARKRPRPSSAWTAPTPSSSRARRWKIAWMNCTAFSSSSIRACWDPCGISTNGTLN
jgi:hypothetical protein